MREDIANLLKMKRKSLGLSVKSVVNDLLAHGIEVSDKALYSWESGYRQPDADTFLALCRIYGINSFSDINEKAPSISNEAMKIAKDYDILDIYGRRTVQSVIKEEKTRCLEQAQRHELSEDLTPYTAGKTVSLYELPVSAGTGMLLQDEQFEFVNLPPGPTTDKADFALRVSGDSMEPKFYSGDIILVQQTPSVEPNEIGVFVLNGAGYVKRLGEAGQLVSLNPAYPDIVSSDGDTLRCLGRVLGKIEN